MNEEKEKITNDFIQWFAENSTPEEFTNEVMILAACSAATHIDHSNIKGDYVFKCTDHVGKIELTVKRL